MNRLTTELQSTTVMMPIPLPFTLPIRLKDGLLSPAAWPLLIAGIGLASASFLAAQAPLPNETVPKLSAARMIIVPRKLVAGQRATLAVLDIQGQLTPDAVVEFSGGIAVKTDSTGRAAFDAPAKSKALFAHLQGRSDKVSSFIVPPTVSAEQDLVVLSYSRVVALTDRFEVSGHGFNGNADGNAASAGGKAALVLAASPVALVLMPAPGLPEGPTEFTLESRGLSAGPFPITFISLEVSAAKRSLAANERGVLAVRVHGSDAKLLIEARNLSPEIVTLPGGNTQREVTSGGDQNIARFALRGLRAGPFSISVRLVPQPLEIRPN